VSCTAASADAARSGARAVAAWIWENRERFRSEHEDPDGAVRAAKRLVAAGTTPVIVNETNDNPGGGAPGDATHLLRAMLDADLTDACFGFITDPETAAAAHRAGVGATISVRVGGKHDDLHGTPIPLTAYVKVLTDGRFTLQRMLAGVALDLGPSCRLVVGGPDGTFDLLVTSQPFQTIDDEVFLLHGVDVRRKTVVGLKSSQHFRAGFADLAGAIVTSDAPGLTTLRTEVFARSRATRPLWPADPEAAWA
jgi:microcystin degradation protein MlrC